MTAVRQQCHELACRTRQRLNALTGLAPICPESPQWFMQMFAARLPVHTDLEALKQRLYDDYRVEVPVVAWHGQKFIRVSLQGYNTPGTRIPWSRHWRGCWRLLPRERSPS